MAFFFSFSRYYVLPPETPEPTHLVSGETEPSIEPFVQHVEEETEQDVIEKRSNIVNDGDVNEDVQSNPSKPGEFQPIITEDSMESKSAEMASKEPVAAVKTMERAFSQDDFKEAVQGKKAYPEKLELSGDIVVPADTEAVSPLYDASARSSYYNQWLTDREALTKARENFFVLDEKKFIEEIKDKELKKCIANILNSPDCVVHPNFGSKLFTFDHDEKPETGIVMMSPEVPALDSEKNEDMDMERWTYERNTLSIKRDAFLRSENESLLLEKQKADAIKNEQKEESDANVDLVETTENDEETRGPDDCKKYSPQEIVQDMNEYEFNKADETRPVESNNIVKDMMTLNRIEINQSDDLESDDGDDCGNAENNYEPDGSNESKALIETTLVIKNDPSIVETYEIELDAPADQSISDKRGRSSTLTVPIPQINPYDSTENLQLSKDKNDIKYDAIEIDEQIQPCVVVEDEREKAINLAFDSLNKAVEEVRKKVIYKEAGKIVKENTTNISTVDEQQIVSNDVSQVASAQVFSAKNQGKFMLIPGNNKNDYKKEDSTFSENELQRSKGNDISQLEIYCTTNGNEKCQPTAFSTPKSKDHSIHRQESFEPENGDDPEIFKDWDQKDKDEVDQGYLPDTVLNADGLEKCNSAENNMDSGIVDRTYEDTLTNEDVSNNTLLAIDNAHQTETNGVEISSHEDQKHEQQQYSDADNSEGQYKLDPSTEYESDCKTHVTVNDTQSMLDDVGKAYAINGITSTEMQLDSLKSMQFEDELPQSNEILSDMNQSLNMSTLQSATVESDSDVLPKDTTFSDSQLNTSEDEHFILKLPMDYFKPDLAIETNLVNGSSLGSFTDTTIIQSEDEGFIPFQSITSDCLRGDSRITYLQTPIDVVDGNISPADSSFSINGAVNYQKLTSDVDTDVNTSKPGRESYKQLGYKDNHLLTYSRVKSVNDARELNMQDNECEASRLFVIQGREGLVTKEKEDDHCNRLESVNFGSLSRQGALSAVPTSTEKYTMDKKFVSFIV